MTQPLQDSISMLLYDLNDEIKVELSILNQNQENITKGPDHRLFERGIFLGFTQGKRQMIHALELLVDQELDDPLFISEFLDLERQISDQQTHFQKNVFRDLEPSNAIYQESKNLAHVYEEQGKAYIIQSIGAKIREIQSFND